MNVAVLIPRRADGGRRDRIWGWLRDRWEAEHPDYKVVEGHHETGQFNRSAAINRAREQVDADVLVIADADTFVSPEALEEAIATAVGTGQMTLAFDRYCYLSKLMSDLVMGGYRGDWHPGVEFTMQGTCSCMVVVTADLFDRCRGFDEGFVGWGGEDIGFSHAAQTFGGGLQRVQDSAVWHLWHPTAPRTHDGWPDRIRAYGEASYNPQAMTELIDRIKDDPDAVL